ncbi:isochorismatase [Thalassospira profundimaris]|uniref:Isochorismatase n=1 Tax=Thalassospira profundimaris TaxID=502049 RepID=A0A367WMJ8_9PROT|nr:cysteine hydrolase family protein [Thalassospira profundimaris]RCK42459.1 isochorismatase [Thalassospira profundimaris]
MSAQTLLSLANANPAPGTPENAALILIDAQEEYRSGALPLPGIKGALENAASLLAHWRAKGGLVVHIVHHSGPGDVIFDPNGDFVAILPEVVPQDDEAIHIKNVPNSFGGTGLQESLEKAGRKNIVLAGFMTHLCVSTTARAGHELGYGVTVVSDATATRDLPLPNAIAGAEQADSTASFIAADKLHQAELTMLGDIFATIASTQTLVSGE